jgi:Ca2+-binding RTX toxin-like protein
MTHSACISLGTLPTSTTRSHSDTNSGQNLVIIDATLENYQSLVAGVKPGISVTVLHPSEDGIEQISVALANYRNLKSLHIVSHGTPGCLHLGASQLSLGTIDRYSLLLTQWQQALAPDAAILVYGCNVATREGDRFLDRLHNLTGAKIAASSTPTGSLALGGDWDLDIRVGEVEVELPFEADVLETYPAVLGTPLFDGSSIPPAKFSLGIDISTPIGQQQGSVDVASFALAVSGKPSLAYGQIQPAIQPNTLGIPSYPILANGSATLDTNGTSLTGVANRGYAGYANYVFQGVLGGSFNSPGLVGNFVPYGTVPTLDRTKGFSIRFNTVILAEASNPNRAGFSIMAIASDGSGIELGFKDKGNDDYIFAQNAAFGEGEKANFSINAATDYILNLQGNTYALFANGKEILTGALRQYQFNPAQSDPPLPANPYTTPNFLFFGDNTDQGYARFTMGAISIDEPFSVPTPASTPTPAPGTGGTGGGTTGGGTTGGGTTGGGTSGGGTSGGGTTGGGTTGGGTTGGGTPNTPDVSSTVITPEPPGISAADKLPAFFANIPFLNGSNNVDNLIGSNDNNRIAGLGGRDTLRGLFGDDYLNGGEGDDSLFGNQGSDYLDGGKGNDVIFGGEGNDLASGGEGNDLIQGNLGNDTLIGNADNDTIYGNIGTDVLEGNDGNDILFGGQEADTLTGGSGGDILSGDRGNDFLAGGTGGDRFDFSLNDGVDLIADFTDGQDIIGLKGGLTFSQLVVSQVDNDTKISAGNALSITLQGVSANAIGAADFALV